MYILNPKKQFIGMEYAEDKLIITHSTWDSKAYLKVYDLHNIIKNLF
jgi:hypothetical protein